MENEQIQGHTGPAESGLTGQAGVGQPAAGNVDQQIAELMANPHYLDGNTNPMEHDRLVKEVTRLYEIQSGGAMLDNETGMAKADKGADAVRLESQAKELMVTPGYLDGSMKQTNPAGYDRLQKQITGLYEQSAALANAQQKAQEAQAQPDLPQGPSLMERANQEIEALRRLGFDCDLTKLKGEIGPHHVEAWEQQRLLAEGNFQELAPKVAQTLRSIPEAAASAALFEQFMQIADFDPGLREEISHAVIKYAINTRHAKFKNEKGTLQ